MPLKSLNTFHRVRLPSLPHRAPSSRAWPECTAHLLPPYTAVGRLPDPSTLLSLNRAVHRPQDLFLPESHHRPREQRRQDRCQSLADEERRLGKQGHAAGGGRLRGRHASQGIAHVERGHCTQRHPPLCHASSTPDIGPAHLFLHKGRLCSLQRLRPPGTAGGEELLADRPPSIQTWLG